jgi:hypothetical protein
MASDALKIVTHEDAVLAKKPPHRAVEQPPAQDEEPDKLMGLLGDIDGLKQEIHERMRRLEAVKQARSLLLEDAQRTEALNKRLAEFGKVMSSVNSGVLAREKEHEDAEFHRAPIREAHSDAEPRHPAIRVMSESGTLAWVRPDTPGDAVGENRDDSSEADQELAISHTKIPVDPDVRIAIDAALKRLEEAEQAREQARKSADEAAGEAKRFLEEATSRLELATGKEEQANLAFHFAREALEADYRTTNERLEEAEQARTRAWKKADEAAVEARQLLQESTSRLETAVRKEEQATLALQSAQEVLQAAYRTTNERLDEAEQARKLSWSQMEAAAVEAKGILDSSNSRLDAATELAEQAAAELQSAQETLRTTYETASKRLEAAEQARSLAWTKSDELATRASRLFEESAARLDAAVREQELAKGEFRSAHEAVAASIQGANERLEKADLCWRRADQAMAEANQLLAETRANLKRVINEGIEAAAQFESSEHARSTAYQSANQRLEDAERFWREADQAIADAKKRMDQSTFQLTEAKVRGDAAVADLQSARQELTTAYQFASVAAQRRLDAASFFQSAVRWAVSATALCWIAMVWAVWSTFRAHVPVFVPGILTAVLLAAAYFLGKIGTREV